MPSGQRLVRLEFTASTDGFVCFDAGLSSATPGGAIVSGWTSSFSTSHAGFILEPLGLGSFVMPVRAGETWRIYAFGPGTDYMSYHISWIPLTV